MEFQGLQNSLPSLITVTVTLFILFLSWYSYRSYSSISFRWKLILGTLRASALILLFFLLLNPFFRTENEIILKPKLAVLLDASESLSIEKGAYKGNESYQNVIASLRNTPSDYEIDFYSFDGTIQQADPGNIIPSGAQTNIYNGIESIITSDIEYASAILVSDGIVTSGKNPVVLSGESHLPFHVIALGDTSKVKDVSIKNITTNGTGFTNSLQQIAVEISQFGFNDQEISINLKSDEQILDSKSLTINSDSEIYETEFELELDSPGLKQFEIEVVTGLDEWLNENNSSSFSIEVLDSKKIILHIASQIHPDVKAFRSILALDRNIELSTYTEVGSNPSIKNFSNSNEYDLVIYHGIPSQNTIDALDLDSNFTGISTLSIFLPNNRFKPFEGLYRLIDTNSSDLFNVQLQTVMENSEHPILEDLPDVNSFNFAPIQSSINSINDYPEAISLFTALYQNIPTNSPLLTVLEQGNIRRSELNASGWFKMYLSPNSNEKEYIEQLMVNLVDWTSSNPDNRLLKIKPSKNSFNSNESPIINASLINENGDIENNGVIEVTITGDDYTGNYSMDNLANGNYKLQVPNLADGKYEFLAIARKGNREIDSQRGEFLVSESSIELANTTRNDDLLMNIALNSNGEFLDFSSVSEIWENEVINSSLIATKEIQESYIFPIRSIYWFFIALILLGTEWLTRKRFSLP